jgi:transketolase
MHRRQKFCLKPRHFFMAPMDPKTLSRISDQCRIEILKMIHGAASGHPGGSLSAIDIMVTLFFTEIRRKPSDPLWPDRDRFILSKGHAVPALYAILAEQGTLPKEELKTLRQINSRLQGHPDRAILPVVEASTGSLGQGLSIAQGVALGLKLQKKDSRVFCLLGDGESQEGQVWETAMSAPKFELNNLIAIVDSNNGQIDGTVEEVMDLRPIAEKWKSFRWNVLEINGHNFDEILQALASAKEEKQRPTVIVAHTIKGRGVSFMEKNMKWHGSAPSSEELTRAVAEIEGRLA